MLGVTGQDPVSSLPGQDIWDFPDTSVLNTHGELWHGRSFTPGVCPRWEIAKGDVLSVLWEPPCVALFKNNGKLHEWETPHQYVWMAIALACNMCLRIHERGLFIF